jgi:cytoplasmic iron level regulating protein YaaA (DUF328/UPF0246 family)
MIVLLSPAKSLDFEAKAHVSKHTEAKFLQESEYLVKKLKKYSAQKIGKLMHISPALSDLNHQRFQEWSLPFDVNNSKQAALAFRGDVYRGWSATTMSEEDLDFAQDHVRILSGLYGIIKPLDLIQPYRLEMGSKFVVTPTVKNLYAFWKKKLTAHLNDEVGGAIIVNLASSEYFKSLNANEVKGTIITPIFKDFKNEEYKIIMTYAKIARGLMTRFIVTNRITEVEQIKAFDTDGYLYNDIESNGNDWVFTRG